MNSLIKWCEEEIKKMEEIMQLMKEGKLKTISYEGTKQVDKTEAWVQEYDRRTKELQAIIDRAA